MTEAGIFVIAWNGFYFHGRAHEARYGRSLDRYGVSREKAEGFPTREEASRILEQLAARQPHREYRIEQVA